MGMTDTDTIYVIIFGESLLNDGVAIVLFHTLVHFLDETVVIDREAVLAGAVHFFIVAFGSLLIGIASGMLSTVYFWLFHGCQTPLVEVLMFFCWALTPYYVCDGIGWSGIVSAVAVGFVMDLHIVGQNEVVDDSEDHGSSLKTTGLKEARIRRQIFSPFGHLSDEARQHIGFVTEIISTTMETAIFAYLGLFLFSHRYHWNLLHTVVAIFACCTSRGLMIPILSFFANWITRFQQNRTVSCVSSTGHPMGKANSSTAGVVIDGRMQIVLWFAGLRGAMSFALVEHIPLFDSVSGEGTRLKPELKAMTSATIMFTVFILGGYTYYMMESLGLTPSPGNNKQGKAKDFEMIALVNQSDDEHSHTDNSAENEFPAMPNIRHVNKQAFRRKQHSGMSME
jgi:NhaP-type Na+/H+ or K+/H+ antiporter